MDTVKLVNISSIVNTKHPWTDIGTVNNSRCTCPAGGAPPFCEIVFAVLYAAQDYAEKSCMLPQQKDCRHVSAQHMQNLTRSSNETFVK
ncbi:hypothetical protein TNCT_388051 [Trichonephila clavata]|uniref:SWIM-type domain-containing protein n=1 Tax=Trichonephila clavata TaxID=2740835 RepID=A0A8X6HQG6_TRICU|nr:hypothetical protein TNCT_388051 [Trichonephila clavata]